MTKTNNTFPLKMARCVGLKLTQERMAKELAVSLRTYCRWEKGGAPERVMKHVALLVSASAPQKPPQDGDVGGLVS